MNPGRLVLLGMLVIFVGFALVAAGSATGGGSGQQSSVGGLILIGPIPIVFGSGPDSSQLATLSVLVAIVMVAASFLTYRRARAARQEASPESVP